MRALLALLLALGLAGPLVAQPFSFVAFGDMPYCRPGAAEPCAEEEARVARLMREINAARPAFSIFVGDTISGAELCTDDRILRAFGWMSLADHPLVYTPGDNEWTDCWRDAAGRFDPRERLALIRARFFAEPRSLGRRPMALLRQADIDPAHRVFVENARWVHNGVLFATAHVVGSNNNRPTDPEERPAIRPPAGAAEEYAARNAANLAWLEAAFAEAARSEARAVVIAIQADLFYVQRCGRGYASGTRETTAGIERLARAFARPVLILNGDIHFFLHDRPMAAAPNVTRIMVPGDRDTRAVRIEVDPVAPDPWRPSLIGPADRAAAARC